MNQSCLLAYQYDEHISIAPYLDTEFESYSEIVSNSIADYRYTTNNRDEFILYVENYLEQTLAETKEICNKIKTDVFYNHSLIDSIHKRR